MSKGKPSRHAEVDQSGKIEQTNTDTILAFSDGKHYAIRIPASVKRAVLNRLKQDHDPAKSRKALPLRVFAAGLYLLLRDYLGLLDRITIDTEYTGHEDDIRGMLLSMIRRTVPSYAGDRIIFQQVGKKSPAHDLAWGVTRGMRRVDRVVTEQELFKLL